MEVAEYESGKLGDEPLVVITDSCLSHIQHVLDTLGCELPQHEIYPPTSIMRLSVGLLLPLFAGATSAVLDAKVYMFQGDEWPNASDPPALSPEETRLVFAQRLGVSQFHSLDDASENTLSYINRFGRRQKQLFEAGGDDKPAELILFVEGTSAENAGPFLNAFSSMQPAFTISNPPSSSENLELVFNMDRQLGPDIPECTLEDDVNPSNQRCWKGKSKIIQIDLAAEASELVISVVYNLLTNNNRDLESARRNSRKTHWSTLPNPGR